MKPPSRQIRLAAALAALALLGGCASTDSINGNLPARGPLLPDTSLNLTPGLQISLEKMVFWGAYGAAAYLILDPLNPNWEIEQATFPDAHYHLALRMKRYYAGGAGEARKVFHDRARELVRRGGYSGYTVLEYNEGLESSVLGSQRTAAGVIQLTVAPEPVVVKPLVPAKVASVESDAAGTAAGKKSARKKVSAKATPRR